jgi:3-dehydroquinate synthase
VDVQLGARSYPIRIGAGLLSDPSVLAGLVAARQVMIVTNEVVAPHYLDTVRAALDGREIGVVVLPDGERHKTLASFALILDRLVNAGFHRDACIVALGGGVVGDVAGFAAASYQRGIDFVQVPTTVLAQVDSSVGGKTAVNHALAKNMIGAFHQPVGVIADTRTLRTLPRRELTAGLAEVVKYGLIQDVEFLGWLESHVDALLALDDAALEHAIARSCEIKAGIVAEDEHERGRRALLNFGHTFGHALEALGRYETWLHGEAVAIGMLMAARVSAALGSISDSDCERIAGLLERVGLPVRASGIRADDVLAKMQLDKKVDRHGLRIILLERLGRAAVVRAPDAAIVRAAVENRIAA